MNCIKTKIRFIANNINDSIKTCNDKFIKRVNKNKSKQLTLTDLIFTSSHLVHSSSYSISNSHLKIMPSTLFKRLHAILYLYY